MSMPLGLRDIANAFHMCRVLSYRIVRSGGANKAIEKSGGLVMPRRGQGRRRLNSAR